MRRVVGVAAVVAASVALAACGSSKPATVGSPLVPVPVVQHVSLPGPVKIGVIYSASGAGLDWSRAVGGASVAAYRFTMGGAKVSLEWQSDQGTAVGAVKAVNQLVSDGVSGIVVASDGAYLDGALKAASKAQVPTILPYYAPATLPSGVWTLAPNASDVGSALAAALAKHSAKHPLVLEADGEGVPAMPGISAVQRISYSTTSIPAASAAVMGLTSKGRVGVDSIVISGNASSQAAMVAQLQQVKFPYAIVLTPHALSANFSQQLAADHGTVAGSLTTVGVNSGDVVALSQGQAGSQASSFYAAAKLAVGAPGVVDAYATPFSAADESEIDTPAHDAVVALVRAVAAAKSTIAASVLAALSKSSVAAAQGLAGPALNFADQYALADPATAVVPLGSTAQDPGVRDATPQSGSPLFWFALSNGS